MKFMRGYIRTSQLVKDKARGAKGTTLIIKNQEKESTLQNKIK